MYLVGIPTKYIFTACVPRVTACVPRVAILARSDSGIRSKTQQALDLDLFPRYVLFLEFYITLLVSYLYFYRSFFYDKKAQQQPFVVSVQ